MKCRRARRWRARWAAKRCCATTLTSIKARVQQGVEVLLRAHVLDGGEVEHEVEGAVGGHEREARPASEVEGVEAELRLPSGRAAAADVAGEAGKAVLVEVDQLQPGGPERQQLAHGGRADGAGGAYHQDAGAAHPGLDLAQPRGPVRVQRLGKRRRAEPLGLKRGIEHGSAPPR